MLISLLQIGDLFQGNFNMRGFIQLVLFFIMGAVVLGFGVWMGINVIRTLKK